MRSKWRKALELLVAPSPSLSRRLRKIIRSGGRGWQNNKCDVFGLACYAPARIVIPRLPLFPIVSINIAIAGVEES